MRKFLKVLGLLCVILAVFGLLALMQYALSVENAPLSAPAPVSKSLILATPTADPDPAPRLLVIAEVLEKRTEPDTGRNIGYWVRGDEVEYIDGCVSRTGDVWVRFAEPVSESDTGWSAALYNLRPLMQPVPNFEEVCGG